MWNTELFIGLEILLDHAVGRTLGAPVPDHCGAALDDLPGAALPVNLAEPGPLAQLHIAVNLENYKALLAVTE